MQNARVRLESHTNGKMPPIGEPKSELEIVQIVHLLSVKRAQKAKLEREIADLVDQSIEMVTGHRKRGRKRKDQTSGQA